MTFTSVGVAKIPNKPLLNLPSVETELNLIARIVDKNKVVELVNSAATIKNVLDEIQVSQWLHVACHGEQTLATPLESGLLLHDGKLKLGDIISTNLPHAQFVYLSACQTAMGDADLINESIHLAGGFIAAGFQGAIGTLWAIADSDGPKLAEMVYERIFAEASKPNPVNAASALHSAIQQLRRDNVPFQRWLPFVHIGV